MPTQSVRRARSRPTTRTRCASSWIYVEAAVRAEAAAHVAAIREAGVAALSSRLRLLAGASAAIVAADDEAPGCFEEALGIRASKHGASTTPRVRPLHGEHLRRTRVITRGVFS